MPAPRRPSPPPVPSPRFSPFPLQACLSQLERAFLADVHAYTHSRTRGRWFGSCVLVVSFFAWGRSRRRRRSLILRTSPPTRTRELRTVDCTLRLPPVRRLLLPTHRRTVGQPPVLVFPCCGVAVPFLFMFSPWCLDVPPLLHLLCPQVLVAIPILPLSRTPNPEACIGHCVCFLSLSLSFA